MFLIFSSSIHCTTFCISTPGCSAFTFNGKTGSCDLGSKIGLIMAQPSDSEAQLTQISINTEGIGHVPNLIKPTYFFYNFVIQSQHFVIHQRNYNMDFIFFFLKWDQKSTSALAILCFSCPQKKYRIPFWYYRGKLSIRKVYLGNQSDCNQNQFQC